MYVQFLKNNYIVYYNQNIFNETITYTIQLQNFESSICMSHI